MHGPADCEVAKYKNPKHSDDANFVMNFPCQRCGAHSVQGCVFYDVFYRADGKGDNYEVKPQFTSAGVSSITGAGLPDPLQPLQQFVEAQNKDLGIDDRSSDLTVHHLHKPWPQSIGIETVESETAWLNREAALEHAFPKDSLAEAVDNYTKNYADHPQTMGELRSDKSSHAHDWSPRDALICVLRDIDSGELEAETIVICIGKPYNKKGFEKSYWTRGVMAGPTRLHLQYVLNQVAFDFMAGSNDKD